jgi:hypothetical protein
MWAVLVAIAVGVTANILTTGSRRWVLQWQLRRQDWNSIYEFVCDGDVDAFRAYPLAGAAWIGRVVRSGNSSSANAKAAESVLRAYRLPATSWNSLSELAPCQRIGAWLRGRVAAWVGVMRWVLRAPGARIVAGKFPRFYRARISRAAILYLMTAAVLAGSGRPIEAVGNGGAATFFVLACIAPKQSVRALGIVFMVGGAVEFVMACTGVGWLHAGPVVAAFGHFSFALVGLAVLCWGAAVGRCERHQVLAAGVCALALYAQALASLADGLGAGSNLGVEAVVVDVLGAGAALQAAALALVVARMRAREGWTLSALADG